MRKKSKLELHGSNLLVDIPHEYYFDYKNKTLYSYIKIRVKTRVFIYMTLCLNLNWCRLIPTIWVEYFLMFESNLTLWF